MPILDPALHRRLAAELFNRTWQLLERPTRTPAEDDAMIHAAHASRHHWGEVGEPKNWAIGEWQISRVYATRNRPEPALHHARRSLDICTEHNLDDFVLAYAHEAIARASALAGDTPARDLHLTHARNTPIADPETRAQLKRDIAQIG